MPIVPQSIAIKFYHPPLVSEKEGWKKTHTPHFKDVIICSQNGKLSRGMNTFQVCNVAIIQIQ